MSDGYTVKVKPRYKETPYCENCQCKQIQVKAWCVWNQVKQCWEFEEFAEDEEAWCPECEDTTTWDATMELIEEVA